MGFCEKVGNYEKNRWVGIYESRVGFYETRVGFYELSDCKESSLLRCSLRQWRSSSVNQQLFILLDRSFQKHVSYSKSLQEKIFLFENIKRKIEINVLTFGIECRFCGFSSMTSGSLLTFWALPSSFHLFPLYSIWIPNYFFFCLLINSTKLQDKTISPLNQL